METLQAMAKLVLKRIAPEVVMHIYCRTPRAILLLGISDERGKASHAIRPEPCRTIFYSETARGDKCQLIEFARSLVDGELADLDVIQNFSDAMTVDGRGDGLSATESKLTPRALSRRRTLLASFAGRRKGTGGSYDQIHAGVYRRSDPGDQSRGFRGSDQAL